MAYDPYEHIPTTRRIIAAWLVCLALLPVWRPTDPQLGSGVPVGVVGDAPRGITAYLRATVKPGDRILNPQPWGSWLELAVPEATVALDSRIEVVPAQVWDDADVETGWLITIGPQGRTTTPGTGPADCTVSGRASDLYQWVWNRAAADRLTVEGDPSLLERWSHDVRIRWS